MIRLSNRERWFAIGSLILIAAWLIYAWGVNPSIERIETLNRVTLEKNLDLAELKTKSKQYLALTEKLDRLQNNASLDGQEFELLPFVESTTKDCKLSGKIAAIKQDITKLDAVYSEVVVQVRLEKITLSQLVTLLSKIKSSDHFLQIKSLYTKKNTIAPDHLDTVLYISTVKQYDPAKT